MGQNRRFRFLQDAVAYEADFVLLCPRCKHRLYIEYLTFFTIAVALGLDQLVQKAGQRLRCTRCGKRGGTVELARRGYSGTVRLSDGDSLPPRGVRIALGDWCRMPEDERQRLRRLMRG